MGSPLSQTATLVIQLGAQFLILELDRYGFHDAGG